MTTVFTAVLYEQGAVSAAFGCANGQQAYAVWQDGAALGAKDVDKMVHVLELAAQTGCPVVTFYQSAGAMLAEGLDALTASAKLNSAIAQVSGVVPQVAVVLGVCGGTSALAAANADVCIMAKGSRAVLYPALHLRSQGGIRWKVPAPRPLPPRPAWPLWWRMTLPAAAPGCRPCGGPAACQQPGRFGLL